MTKTMMLPEYLIEKRNEIILHLVISQGFSPADIAKMFKVNPSTISRVLDSKPANWSPKWVKAK